MKHLSLLLLVLILSGCSGGAVVFAPTPLPPDFSPVPYVAPGGIFTLVLPRNWSVYEQNTTTLVAASFAPPGNDSAIVQVGAINTGQVIDSAILAEMVSQYQTQIRPDLEHYTEQDRQLMSDGSWRVTGVRLMPGGINQQVNTFLQANGTVLALLEVIVPPATDFQTQLQTLMNTFTLSNQTTLASSSMSTLAGMAASGLEVTNVSTWETTQGVFFVTGEIANHTGLALANVPVQATLTGSDGASLADATDVIMGHSILPGGFAPFSLRFGQGQPQTATNFTLSLGNATWEPVTQDVVSADTLTWENNTQFSPDGSLFVVGKVTNNGLKPVKQARAVATVFDAGGRVIAAGYVDLDNFVLDAGKTADFTILVPEAGGVPANYIVNVQALPCDTEC